MEHALTFDPCSHPESFSSTERCDRNLCQQGAWRSAQPDITKAYSKAYGGISTVTRTKDPAEGRLLDSGPTLIRYLSGAPTQESLRTELGQMFPRSMQRIEQSRWLGGDWDSYGGLPPSRETVCYAYLLLSELIDAATSTGKLLPEPGVLPGPTGTLQFEWELGDREFEIEFSVNAGMASITYLLCASENEEDWEEGEMSGSIQDQSAVRQFLGWLK
jgi:hypothetical protein